MNVFYIILIVGVIAGFELGKDLFKYFFNKKNKQFYQTGFNDAATHIYNQIKKEGKIDLILDGNKMTLIESNNKVAEIKK